jgi:hypothetical protein
MKTGPEVPPSAADNPAAAADAEQHALQQIAGLRGRAVTLNRGLVWLAMAIPAGVLSGWLIRRWRRRRR